MQPTIPATFPLVHLPLESQEVSSVSCSNLPMTYPEMVKFSKLMKIFRVSVINKNTSSIACSFTGFILHHKQQQLTQTLLQ